MGRRGTKVRVESMTGQVKAPCDEKHHACNYYIRRNAALHSMCVNIWSSLDFNIRQCQHPTMKGFAAIIYSN